jgi:hypothetical protein
MRSVYERAQAEGKPLEIVYVPVQDPEEKTKVSTHNVLMHVQCASVITRRRVHQDRVS